MLKRLLNSLSLWWYSKKIVKAVESDIISDIKFVPQEALVEELNQSYKLGPATVYIMQNKEELQNRMMNSKADKVIKHLELTEKAENTWLKN